MATLICPDRPSPVVDAEALRKAVKGWGTDETVVISILGHRNATQRKLIRKTYEDLYQEDLVKRLESELSGHFEKAMYRWIHDPEDRDAILLNVAIKQKPVDYTVIVEISCIRSPDQLLAIKRAYQIRYKHSFEEDLAQNTTGDLRKENPCDVVGKKPPAAFVMTTDFILKLVKKKYQGEEIDTRLAKTEANILRCAIAMKSLNDEDMVRIINTRSKAQVLATMNHYKDHYGASITKHLRDNPPCDYVSALHTAIRCINDYQKYYEKVIRYALNKGGTDEDSLTRVVVTRAEVDLKDIKDLYRKRNSVDLEKVIVKETSGDYKAFLLTLLGNQD